MLIVKKDVAAAVPVELGLTSEEIVEIVRGAQQGDEVIVTGFDMGSNRWGAYGDYIRVPQDWVVPMPAGLSIRESMILGTAGLTA